MLEVTLCGVDGAEKTFAVDGVVREVSASAVIALMTAGHFNVPPDALKGDRRRRTDCIARQSAMYLISRYRKLSLNQIGLMFNRHHTTVLKSIQHIQALQEDGWQGIANLEELVARHLAVGAGNA